MFLNLLRFDLLSAGGTAQVENAALVWHVVFVHVLGSVVEVDAVHEPDVQVLYNMISNAQMKKLQTVQTCIASLKAKVLILYQLCNNQTKRVEKRMKSLFMPILLENKLQIVETRKYNIITSLRSLI